MIHEDDVRRLPLDIERVGRSITLRAEALEGFPRKYCIYGDAEVHYVDLRAGDGEIKHWSCDCGDFTWRDVACKHISSALIADNDEEAVTLMFEWINRDRASRRRPSGSEMLRMDPPDIDEIMAGRGPDAVKKGD